MLGPNITGDLQGIRGDGGLGGSGAFSLTSWHAYRYDGYSSSGGGKDSGYFPFSAQKSSSIYSPGGHVYPLSLALNFIIKC
ncbi:hypothetical protein [Succinivibrio dextrinosolvens]|nr:hypothetical protein [Succinivibrio dextrinosolvens]